MSNNPVTMQKVRSILQLLQRGYSGRKIAEDLVLSRNTVSLYLERFKACAYSLEQLQQMDDAGLHAIVYTDTQQVQADPRVGHFKSRMSYFLAELKRTGVTKQLLWKEYKMVYPDGFGYSYFCELFAQHKKVDEASMHFQHKAGDRMMVDFAGDNLSYVNKDSGELISCPVFVAVLPYSGYSFAIALPNATQPHVIKALNMCVEYFGGVPQSLKSDNMKTAVIKSCRYEPVFNDTLVRWSLHNDVVLEAARVRKPKDKALVENEVKLVYQRIYAPLRDKVFFSLAELNAHIVEQLKIHHQCPFQKKDYSRQECFIKLEQPILQPLPAETFVMTHVAEAKVQKNYHITLGEDWHHYSVPFSYIGKTVNAIYDTDTVEVFLDHKRIALHVRSYKRHGFTTVKEHMPEHHRRYSEQMGWTAEYFIEKAKTIGPSTHLYIQHVLKAKRFTEQTYNGCLGILRLANAYTSERLEASCKRALTGSAFSYSTINNILTNKLDTLIDPPSGPSEIPLHGNVRGPEAYC